MRESLSVLLLAVVFDLLGGEPPSALHPVVWIGWFYAFLRRFNPRHPAAAFVWGLCMALLGPLVFAAAAAFVLAHTSGLVHLVLAAFLLKSTFSIRELGAAAERVRRASSAGDLPSARWHLRSLVSRDPSNLGPPLVAAAAIESTAENTSDAIVAPLFFYVVGGVPAALAYRAINTLDSLIGYRGKFEWLGKAAARLDDLVNLVPARLSALLLALAAPLGRGSFRRALAIGWRDGSATASPNAGHPMAVMAGALGVELEKEGCYRLGVGLAPPAAADIGRAVRVMAGAAALAVTAVALLDVATRP